MKIFIDLSYTTHLGEPTFLAKVLTTKGWGVMTAKDILSVWNGLKPYCRQEDKLFITAEDGGYGLCNCARADGFRASAIVSDTLRSVLIHKNRP